MFKKTDSQESLFATSNQLPESAKRRLKGSWAQTFAEEIMPILLDVEEKFAGMYDSHTGRPAFSVARKLGLLLLQHMFDLDDQSALDEMQFDIRWQYALGVKPEDAYLSRRSYVQFRTDLVDFDPQMSLVEEVFDRVTHAAMEQLEIDGACQRIDSSLIISNVQVRGRRWLFAQTLLKFLRQLERLADEPLDEAPELMRQWYDKRQRNEGWFGGPNAQDSPSLEQMAPWLAWVATQFGDDETIKDWESYQLVARVVDEHCQIKPTTEAGASASRHTRDTKTEGAATSAAKVELRDEPKNGGSSMQTPHDPDVAYGHKGPGYHVHVVETCGNKEKPELLTAWMLLAGNHNDWSKTQPAYDKLEASGRVPDKMYADAGYPTPASLIDARRRGSQLHAPVSAGVLGHDYVGRDHFEKDEQGRVTRCPVGRKPVNHTTRKYHAYDEPIAHAVFAGCQGCPLEGKCPARHSHGDKWYVALDERLQARDEALSAQRADEWWDEYSIRSGVEATVAELKGSHGMAKLRVRGRRRVELAVGLKMIACNIKRWTKHAPSDPGHHFLVCPCPLPRRFQRPSRPKSASPCKNRQRIMQNHDGSRWLAVPVTTQMMN